MEKALQQKSEESTPSRVRLTPEQSHRQLEGIIKELEGSSKMKRSAGATEGVEILKSPEGIEYTVRTIEDENEADKIHEVLAEGNFTEDELESPEDTQENIREGYSTYKLIEEKGKPVATINTQYIKLGNEGNPQKSILAGWYLATKKDSRGKGLGTELYIDAYRSALENARKNKDAITAIIGETVDDVEPFLNKMKNKRMYYEDKDGNVREVPYKTAPLDFDEETGDIVKKPTSEHLMIHLIDGRQELSVDELIEMVNGLYADGYKWAEEDFKGPNAAAAFKKADGTVDALVEELEQSLSEAKGGRIFLMSAEEREQKQKELSAKGKKLFELERGTEESDDKDKEKSEPQQKKEVSPALEKALNDAREKYATAYKKFLEDRKKNAGYLKRGWRWINGSNVADSEIPPELKALEAEYDRKAVEYGQEMFRIKQDELEKSALTDDAKKNELARFKQNEIFTRVIVAEQSKLNALKAENLPPKEKSVWKKGLDWYIRQGRWTKLAISVTAGTLFFAAFAPGSIAATGGLAASIGTRALRGVTGMTGSQIGMKAYEYLFKDKSAKERANAEKELAEMFGEETFDASLTKSKKEYAEILEREQKAKRNRLITKAMIGIAAGGVASYFTPSLMDSVFGGDVETPAGLKPSQPATPTTSNAQQIIKPEAIIHKGEGIEHALRRQIEADPSLAEKLGWKPGTDLHKFSGGAAHRMALDQGYVDRATGEEIRVSRANEIAYQIKTGTNGEISVNEIKVKDGVAVEEHTSGSKFEGAGKEDYEYRFKGTPKESATNAPVEIQTPEKIKAGIEKMYDAQPYPGERLEDYNERMALKDYIAPEVLPKYDTQPYPGERLEDYNERMALKDYIAPEVLPKTRDVTTTLKTQAPPGFSKNPFHLTEEAMKEVLNTHGKNLFTLFPENMIEKWDQFSGQKVKAIIENDITVSNPPNIFDYVRKLHTVTGLNPIGGIFRREENIGSYVARALQKASEIGKLDEVKL